MSDHFNSFLLNDVLIRLEADSFFADIGEERTLSFVRRALALSRHYDGNPGEALAGVGQRLGICYYCWDRGADLRQGICQNCRSADAIGIEPDEAARSSPREVTISYGFIDARTVRSVLGLLAREFTSDLDIWNLRKLPGNCIDQNPHRGEIYVDSAWGVDYLPGRRRPWGTPALMIELLTHPYPGVVQRLRRYATLLSEDLRRSRNVEDKPPLIVPVLLYNGLPTWTPRQVTEGWNTFEYTFIDVGRLPPNRGRPHRLTAAFSGVRHPHPYPDDSLDVEGMLDDADVVKQLDPTLD